MPYSIIPSIDSGTFEVRTFRKARFTRVLSLPPNAYLIDKQSTHLGPAVIKLYLLNEACIIYLSVTNAVVYTR